MIIIGHRGAKGEIRGNSLGSIQRAIDSGVDMIEFDVMNTLDNVPVLYHGLRFSSWGRKQLPEKLTFEELSALKPNIATLEQALEICGNMMLDVDIKTANVKPILDALENHFGRQRMIERVLISSHLSKTLVGARKLYPEIRIATYSNTNPISWLFHHWRVRLFAVGTPKKMRIFVQPLARLAGIETYVYSVNQKSLLKKYEKLGVWAVLTNRPSQVARKD